jgi:hypothetical protein
VFSVRYEQVFHVPEGGIFHSHRLENLKSYIPSVFVPPLLSETKFLSGIKQREKL